MHQEDLDRGYLKGTKYPSTKLQATCNGQSNLGAVCKWHYLYVALRSQCADWQNGTPNLTTDDPFAMQAASQPNINAVSTGLHALLGAELCRLTKNTTYCDYASSSMHWIDRVLLSPNHLIDDNVNGSTCKRVPHQFTCEPILRILKADLLQTMQDYISLHMLSWATSQATRQLQNWRKRQLGHQ